MFKTCRGGRGILPTMTKTLGVALAAGALVIGGAATAGATGTFKGSGNACHVSSETSQTQSRNASGMVAAPTHYGPVRKVVVRRHHRRHVKYVRTVTRYIYAGTQHSTVTTTITRCGSDETTNITSTPWTGASVVTSTSIQRVR